MKRLQPSRSFEEGAIAAGTIGTVWILVVFLIWYPTSDYRARLSFIFSLSGADFSLDGFFLAAVWVPAIILLAIVRRFTFEGLVGGAFGAMACLVLLRSGLPSRLPEFGDVTHRVIVTTTSAGLILLFGIRRILRSRVGGDTA